MDCRSPGAYGGVVIYKYLSHTIPVEMAVSASFPLFFYIDGLFWPLPDQINAGPYTC